ncbi:MAG: hypothetical protein KY393_03730, partial [Actinobacteria bacterium]|nr:hypothetical protein [Actinomycetota bacterium]
MSKDSGSSRHHDVFVQFGVLVTQLHYRLHGILLMLRATDEAIDRLKQAEWFDPKSDHWINKQRMKDLGGAIFSYRRLL